MTNITTNKQITHNKKELLADIRLKRNILLSASDCMALPDHPKYSQSILEYRQALRDLPAVYTDNPEDVVFPVAP